MTSSHSSCLPDTKTEGTEGWGPWRGGKGSSSLAHKGKQITPLDLPIPSQGFRCLLAIVSPYKPQTRGPVRAHLDHMSLSQTHESGLCTHFISRLCLKLTISHTLTQHNTYTLLPEPERHNFTPKRVLLGCLWSWSDSPSASRGRPEFEPGFLPVWWVGLPNWFLSLSRFLCATRSCPLSSLEESLPPLRSTWSGGAW
jgi:hypothetical protein